MEINSNSKINIYDELRFPLTAHLNDKYMVTHTKVNELNISNIVFSKPTIALGNKQTDKCITNSYNYAVIRKETNGTAVFMYDSELVLSIAIGCDVFSTPVVSKVQNWFINKILTTLTKLGVKGAEVTTKASRLEYMPSKCFSAYTKDEIIIGARKLVGCTFKKENNVFFGHCMVYMNNSYQNLYKCLVDEVEVIKPISLLDLGIIVNKNDIINILKRELDE